MKFLEGSTVNTAILGLSLVASSFVLSEAHKAAFGMMAEAHKAAFGMMANGLESGLKGMMSTRGSGADHLEAGLGKHGEALGEKLAERPLQLQVTIKHV